MLSADTFLVEEITSDGKRLRAGEDYDFASPDDWNLNMPFTHFVLEKWNWNTTDALAAIGRKCHVSARRFNFAGTKDRNAHTTQIASAYGVDPQKLMAVHV